MIYQQLKTKSFGNWHCCSRITRQEAAAPHPRAKRNHCRAEKGRRRRSALHQPRTLPSPRAGRHPSGTSGARAERGAPWPLPAPTVSPHTARRDTGDPGYGRLRGTGRKASRHRGASTPATRRQTGGGRPANGRSRGMRSPKSTAPHRGGGGGVSDLRGRSGAEWEGEGEWATLGRASSLPGSPLRVRPSIRTRRRPRRGRGHRPEAPPSPSRRVQPRGWSRSASDSAAPPSARPHLELALPPRAAGVAASPRPPLARPSPWCRAPPRGKRTALSFAPRRGEADSGRRASLGAPRLEVSGDGPRFAPRLRLPAERRAVTERRGGEAPARAAGSARPFCRPVKCHGSPRLLPAAAAPRVVHLGRGQRRGRQNPPRLRRAERERPAPPPGKRRGQPRCRRGWSPPGMGNFAGGWGEAGERRGGGSGTGAAPSPRRVPPSPSAAGRGSGAVRGGGRG